MELTEPFQWESKDKHAKTVGWGLAQTASQGNGDSIRSGEQRSLRLYSGKGPCLILPLSGDRGTELKNNELLCLVETFLKQDRV